MGSATLVPFLGAITSSLWERGRENGFGWWGLVWSCEAEGRMGREGGWGIRWS